MDFEQIRTLMAAEHEVKLPGAALLFIANVLKDRQLSIMAAIGIAENMGAPASKLEDLHLSSDANEVMGGIFLKLIAESFSEEFMEQFISGDIEIPDTPPGYEHMFN